MRVHNKERYTMKNNFAMFTTKGNYEVGKLVDAAIAGEWSWEKTSYGLTLIGMVSSTEEATDTEVRERVWEAMVTFNPRMDFGVTE